MIENLAFASSHLLSRIKTDKLNNLDFLYLG